MSDPLTEVITWVRVREEVPDAEANRVRLEQARSRR